ncbi:hypothetical protein EYF80_002060 [Liparis tanakae]|uniref:Uncharacterized protein n=1 Tax=Liparis tanakae TaxID=230148 RepID=A0A4Z2JD83_9TELE|nr:hypothetical protein EYF80_002060 [Liparis tanakae]
MDSEGEDNTSHRLSQTSLTLTHSSSDVVQSQCNGTSRCPLCPRETSPGRPPDVRHSPAFSVVRRLEVDATLSGSGLLFLACTHSSPRLSLLSLLSLLTLSPNASSPVRDRKLLPFRGFSSLSLPPTTTEEEEEEEHGHDRLPCGPHKVRIPTLIKRSFSDDDAALEISGCYLTAVERNGRPQRVAQRRGVYCRQRFNAHQRALNPAPKPGKQQHSEAKGTLGESRQSRLMKPTMRHSELQPNICINFCLMRPNLASEIKNQQHTIHALFIL